MIFSILKAGLGRKSHRAVRLRERNKQEKFDNIILRGFPRSVRGRNQLWKLGYTRL